MLNIKIVKPFGMLLISEVFYRKSFVLFVVIKVKLSLWQAEEAHRAVRRRRGSHILDRWLTDGGEVVSFTRKPPFTPPPQEDSWYSFLLEAESTPGA
jgi:hypothetical protein